MRGLQVDSWLNDLMQTLVPGTPDQRLHFLPELFRIRSRIMRIESLLIFPDANNSQMIGPSVLLQNFKPDAVCLFQRGGRRELLQSGTPVGTPAGMRSMCVTT